MGVFSFSAITSAWNFFLNLSPPLCYCHKFIQLQNDLPEYSSSALLHVSGDLLIMSTILHQPPMTIFIMHVILSESVTNSIPFICSAWLGSTASLPESSTLLATWNTPLSLRLLPTLLRQKDCVVFLHLRIPGTWLQIHSMMTNYSRQILKQSKRNSSWPKLTFGSYPSYVQYIFSHF